MTENMVQHKSIETVCLRQEEVKMGYSYWVQNWLVHLRQDSKPLLGPP